MRAGSFFDNSWEERRLSRERIAAETKSEIGGIYASEKVILMLRDNPVDLWKHSLKHKDNCNDDTDAQYGTKRSDNWEGVNV